MVSLDLNEKYIRKTIRTEICYFCDVVILIIKVCVCVRKIYFYYSEESIVLSKVSD